MLFISINLDKSYLTSLFVMLQESMFMLCWTFFKIDGMFGKITKPISIEDKSMFICYCPTNIYIQ